MVAFSASLDLDLESEPEESELALESPDPESPSFAAPAFVERIPQIGLPDVRERHG